MKQHALQNNFFSEFECRIEPLRQRLLSHPIYKELGDVEAIQRFMQYHVFAVWDFMSLLKSLQRSLTCVENPWRPVANPQLSRLINEIVLAEESDEIGPGQYISHFELYLRAMHEVGADADPMHGFLRRVCDNPNFDFVIDQLSPEGGVFEFMHHTFQLAKGEPHEVAAAFLFGREDIIPDMFARILKHRELFHTERFRFFRFYLERHVEMDGDHHGPMGRKMLVALCGESSEKWRQAERAAATAIEARIQLWNFIEEKLVTLKSSSGVSRAFLPEAALSLS